MVNGRGFAFTLDALLAAMVLAIAMGTVAYLASHAEKGVPSEPLLKKQADDALAVLNYGTALSSRNATLMNSTLGLLLSGGPKYNLTVTYYYSAGGGFSENGTVSAGYPETSAKSVASAQRAFVAIDNGTVAGYGIGKLDLWVG